MIIFTQEAIVTNNQLLLWGKEINDMTKPNCSFDFILFSSEMLIFYLLLRKVRKKEMWNHMTNKFQISISLYIHFQQYHVHKI